MRGVLCGAWTAGAGGRLDGFEVGVGEDAELSGAAARAARVIERVIRWWPWSMRRWHSWQAASRFSSRTSSGVWLRWAVVRPTTEPVSG